MVRLGFPSLPISPIFSRPSPADAPGRARVHRSFVNLMRQQTPRTFPWTMRRFVRLGLALAAASAHPVGAQEPEEPLVRRGTVRLEFAPEHGFWHSRFGKRTEGGSTIEEVEPLGFDLTRDDVGTAVVPTLEGFQDLVSEALAEPGFLLDLGSVSTEWSYSRTRVPFRVDVGVFDWLTISGTVPLVKTEALIDAVLLGDSTNANAGLNPALDDPGAVGTFLSNLGTDVTAFEATAAGVCADLGAESPECQQALGLLTEGLSLETSLGNMYGDTEGFAPLQGTSAGAALESRVTDFQAGVESFGQATTAGAPPLAEQPLTSEDFQRLVTEPAYGVASAPLIPYDGQWGLGDVEVGAAIRLLDGFTTRPANAGFRYRLGVEAKIRLATGTVAHPDTLQQMGTGTGQSDVEARVFGSAFLGRRWELFGHARMGFRQGADLVRRVTPPDVVLSPFSSKALVTWKPGNTFEIYAAPRYRMNDALALMVPYALFSKRSDSYTLAATGQDPSAEPIDASVLNEETEATLHRIGVGAIFSTLPAFRRGESSLPLQLRAVYQTAIGGKGGQTPKLSSLRVTLRLFLSFWGDGA